MAETLEEATKVIDNLLKTIELKEKAIIGLNIKLKDALAMAQSFKSHGVETTYKQYEREHSKRMNLQRKYDELINKKDK